MLKISSSSNLTKKLQHELIKWQKTCMWPSFYCHIIITTCVVEHFNQDVAPREKLRPVPLTSYFWVQICVIPSTFQIKCIESLLAQFALWQSNHHLALWELAQRWHVLGKQQQNLTLVQSVSLSNIKLSVPLSVTNLSHP